MQRIFEKLAKLGMKLVVSCKWLEAKMSIISTLDSVVLLHCPEFVFADNTHRSPSVTKRFFMVHVEVLDLRCDCVVRCVNALVWQGDIACRFHWLLF